MGITVRQKAGYQAYIPKPLPPNPHAMRGEIPDVK
jgi:hypothetical protein